MPVFNVKARRKSKLIPSAFPTCLYADAETLFFFRILLHLFHAFLTRLPKLPNSRIGEFLPYHWISADYSLPSWEGQIQTEHPGKDEGGEP